MLMISLVGYTGFVGSNIYAKAGNKIDKVYNTKNINEAYGTKPDLLIYSGLRAEKYLANNEPYKDMELIIEAQENIKTLQEDAAAQRLPFSAQSLRAGSTLCWI